MEKTTDKPKRNRIDKYTPIKFSERNKQWLEEFKSIVKICDAKLCELIPTYQRAAALQRLEECFMWTAKALRADQVISKEKVVDKND